MEGEPFGNKRLHSMSIKELMNLDGKTALVTGGLGYLGSQICDSLVELGSKVISVSRGNSQSFSNKLDASKEFVSLKYDLSSKRGVDCCLREVLSLTDRLDILINNFYTFPKVFHLFQQDWSDYERTFSTGLISPLYLTKEVLGMMVDGNIAGSIINIASMYGKVSPDVSIYGDPEMVGKLGVGIEYCASKAGLIQITKYIASIGGRHGIRCNSISPGPFSKPGTFKDMEWFEKNLKRKTMLDRVGKNDELKGAIVLLATDLGSYITGTDIAVDGGWTAW